jgi:hydrogenase maturation protease
VPDSLSELLAQSNRRILFVGIGNVLKQDDGIGVYISNHLKEGKNVRALTVEVSIENYIGKINSTDHDILVLIDCADMKKRPGTYELFTVNRIQDMTFNTHNISLKKLSEFFRKEVLILGVQPEKVAFGEGLSDIVKATGNRIIELINKQGG